MQKKTMLLWIIVLIIIGTLGWAYSNWKTYAPETYVQESADSNGTTIATTVNTSTGTTTPGAPSYTSTQVSEHDSASSCYTIIDSKVYDLTLWVNMHPGGKQGILALCGVDGTARFMAKHKGAQKQVDILTRFYVGNLKQ